MSDSCNPATVAMGRSKPTAGGLVDLICEDANDMQHDAVLDYYGRRLATCSSDKTIKIFEVENESHRLVETLKGYVDTVRGHLAVISSGLRQHAVL